MKKLTYFLGPALLLPNLLHAQTCESSKGINLSESPGPYSNVQVRNQGQNGNCFAYSATNLLQSYTKTNDYLNVFDAALANDQDVNGGDPASVIDAISERGWVCKDNGGLFSNLFRSKDQNIIDEVSEAILGIESHRGMPVFYVNNSPFTEAGHQRQENIASLAAKMARGEVTNCNYIKDYTTGYKEYLDLVKKVNAIDSKIEKLKDEKSSYGAEWFWTSFGYRSNESVNNDIAAQKKKKAPLETKKEKAYARYDKAETILTKGKNNLDEYSEQKAAEIVYFWAKETYPAVKAIFTKYGIGQYVPTMSQYIQERVKADPVKQSNNTYGYSYAGGMYPYALVKNAVENGCAKENRVSIPKDIHAETYSMRNVSYDVVDKKIQILFEKKNPQGVGISLHASAFAPTSGIGSDMHAVNLIGCRTVNGVMEYLVQNSWGYSCTNYHTQLQKPEKCVGGRVWVSAKTLVYSASGIQWIEKNKAKAK